MRLPWLAAISTVALSAGPAPSAARTIPGVGPHERVDVTSSSIYPGVSAGLGYSAVYHAVGAPHADPPALRRLVIQLPRGTRIDTSVPGRCTASDMEIMLVGESACPPSSKVGSGQARAKVTGLGTMTFDTVLYNAPSQQLELVESNNRVVGVVHTYIRGTTLDGPIPTCLSGGQPPAGCPSDQITLLSNHLSSAPITVGTGTRRRNYGTTPSTCPSTRRWTGSVAFYYADGSVDRVVFQQPCHPARRRTGRA